MLSSWLAIAYFLNAACNRKVELRRREEAPSILTWCGIPQYVLTLRGILEFTTKGAETFTTHPGDVLVAEDHIGTGHKWRLVNDEPWRRAYVIFAPGVDTQFIPD